MKKKTFILGVGAQKAGTTWLWDYLSRRREGDVGFQKEYHIFDAITVQDCAGLRREVERKVNQLLFKGFDAWKNRPVIQRLNFMSNPASYFDYFCGLLTPSDIHFTCDLTPSYSALSVETLAFIKTGFEKRGVEVSPIFLMRDPVRRLRSMINMEFRNNGISPSPEQELNAMRQMCGSPRDAIRSSYDVTYRNITDVFGERKYVGFFETLFNEKSIKGICDYLNLDYVAADFGTKKNESKSRNVLEPRLLREFRQQYKRQYDFCSDVFGDEFIRGIWDS